VVVVMMMMMMMMMMAIKTHFPYGSVPSPMGV